ncbi:hypothetical protein P353_09190 [Comamonas testosteroni]|uniref:Uncharacterized protein n=1 Tax=Comamonas testosteroni TaxID=285 RepID=A0A096HP54_COMTE|nr:hypothetical protein P353_09190 [Comamonas testosteroni]
MDFSPSKKVSACAVGRSFTSDTPVPMVWHTKASRAARLPVAQVTAASGFLQRDLIFSVGPNGLKFLDLGCKPSLAM